jgi:hypothetical protein
MAYDVHPFDAWRGKHEGALHSDTVRDASHAERPVEAVGLVQTDHDALKRLNALLSTLDNLDLDPYRVPDLDLWAALAAAVEHLVQFWHAYSSDTGGLTLLGVASPRSA